MHALLLALALAADPTAPSIPSAPPFASLQGGETLGVGGSEAGLVAGFSTFQATYAQGITDSNDLGAQLELDWITSELFAGGLYRQLTWRSGDVFVSWRLRAGLYSDFGSTWAVSANRSGTGIQAAPGAALSVRLPRGILSLNADVPFDFIFSNGGGVALGVRGAVAFETPLWGDLMAGARMGAGGLWSRSGAPFAADSPRATLDLSALLTYRLF